MGTAAAIVIFVGHMSVIAGLWPVHVVHTYNTIARQVYIIVIYNLRIVKSITHWLKRPQRLVEQSHGLSKYEQF